VGLALFDWNRQRITFHRQSETFEKAMTWTMPLSLRLQTLRASVRFLPHNMHITFL
jgi:hypothetical protein